MPASNGKTSAGSAAILGLLENRPIVPVIVIDAADDAVPLVEALVAGGIDIIEVTLRSPAAIDAIGRIAGRFGNVAVGAGTVVTVEQARQAIGAGASFGVAPGLNPAIVEHFQAAGVPFAPGVMTPTETERALSLGCTVMKFFPAEAAGGVPFLKALAGPYRSHGVRYIPTGGITGDNLDAYLALDMVVSVGGSWMAGAGAIRSGDWPTITRLAREAMKRASLGR